MASTQADADTKDAVTLRFTGTGSGRRTYIGPSSGARYMFDSEDFKERLVNPADVDALMAMGAFEKVEAEKPAAKASKASEAAPEEPKAEAVPEAPAESKASAKKE
jgi:Ni,Fe-hydrogenase III small subunit